MFTPIKNLITYIQKNASGGSSIFGGSNTSASQESNKMETENVKPQSDSCIDITKDCDGVTAKVSVKSPTKTSTRLAAASTPASKLGCATTATATLSPVTRTSPRKANTSSTTMSTTTATTSESTVIEDDDIEAQLDTSIMLKKPVKHTRTHSTEILEVKKSPQSMGRSIYISHDYNRNHAVASPIEDELDDFRHDPTEVVVASSPLRDQSEEEGGEPDVYLAHDEETALCNSETEDFEQTIDASEGRIMEDTFEDCEGDETEHTIDVDVDGHEIVEVTEHDVSVGGENVILVDSEIEDDSRDGLANIEHEYEMEEVHEDDVEDTYLELNTFPGKKKVYYLKQ